MSSDTTTSVKIHAYVFNPSKSLFKEASKEKAYCRVIRCDDPGRCDLYKNCNTCVLRNLGMSHRPYCPFGKSDTEVGYTSRAVKFHTWISDKTSEHQDVLQKLSSPVPQRIFKAQNYYCFCYPNMKGPENEGYALQTTSDWVHESDVTAELLNKICEAVPRVENLFGEVKTIKSYQEKVVPKFIQDLNDHYPDLFGLLSDKNKTRIANITYVGRLADIKTCKPGVFTIRGDAWKWDGTDLMSDKMLMQPIEGKVQVKIRPDEKQGVVISDDNQVSSETVFLD